MKIIPQQKFSRKPAIAPIIVGIIFTGMWIIGIPWQSSLQHPNPFSIETIITVYSLPMLLLGIVLLVLGFVRLIPKNKINVSTSSKIK